MIDTVALGLLAAQLNKNAAVKRQQGRAGRNVKGSQMAPQLRAAGSPRMPQGVIGYPRGQSL